MRLRRKVKPYDDFLAGRFTIDIDGYYLLSITFEQLRLILQYSGPMNEPLQVGRNVVTVQARLGSQDNARTT